MKNFSRSALGLLLTSLCVSPAFAATQKPATKPVAAHDVASPAAGASAEIELVHSLGADKGEQLQKLVDRFNAKTTGPKIVIQDRPWNAGTLPHLMILGERDQQAFLSGATRYRPLHQVMKEAGIKMETLRAPAMMTPTPLDSANRLVALPVGLSTPVMFYNKQAFKEAGLDTESAPPTWQALQGALGKLVAAGQSCPYTTAQPAWILVENTSAWHNEPVATQSGKTTVAVRLAKYLADKRRNVILLLCDMTAPMLPCICPAADLECERSLGSVLAAAHVSENLVKNNLVTHMARCPPISELPMRQRTRHHWHGGLCQRHRDFQL